MSQVRLIEVKEEILADNNESAANINSMLRSKGIFMLNLMSSPGSGKTSLILQTIRGLKPDIRSAVVEADIDSIVDAEKVAAEDVPAIQLRTGGACHVDAPMMDMSLKELNLDELDFIIMENVGNLVCPAEFDIGATKRAMILSVPEGDDKPLKYPLMFSVCDALVVNKMDYLPFSDFDIKLMRERVLKLNPGIKIFEVSCRTGEGIPAWLAWLKEEIKKVKQNSK